MLARFLNPDAYYRSLADIDFAAYYRQGYRLLLLDLDNTLIRHGQKSRTSFSSQQIRRMKAAGFQVSILSNGIEERVRPFAQAHHIPYIALASKPSRQGVQRACAQFCIAVDKTLLIGDQILTDIICGKRAGTGTILVAPLTEREAWYIQLKRVLETGIKKDLIMQPRKTTPRRKLLRRFWQQERRSNKLSIVEKATIPSVRIGRWLKNFKVKAQQTAQQTKKRFKYRRKYEN